MSKIVVMSLAISDVFIPGFQQDFTYIETSYVKVSILTIDEMPVTYHLLFLWISRNNH